MNSIYNTINPDRALRKKKRAKERDLMRMVTDAYVQEFLENFDLEYTVSHNKKNTVVAVHIKEKIWAEFRITWLDAEKYLEELRAIPERVTAIKALYENMTDNVTIVRQVVQKNK